MSLSNPRTQMKLSTKSTIYLGLAILLIGFVAFAFVRDSAEDMSLASTNPMYLASAKSDPLHEVLQLIEHGDMDSAIEKFMANGETNWIETTSLKEFTLSEADFMSLGTFFSRHKQTPLQQKFIQRVTEIKQMARIVRDRAIAAKSQGDTKTANDYIHAINRLGEQLKNSNTVLVFQQTGMALESFTIP